MKKKIYAITIALFVANQIQAAKDLEIPDNISSGKIETERAKANKATE